ncbi:MAG: lysylphosphatidylglycerol synthase domain-containing protein [Sinobacteraceae bacterium]|nr:lysylphosphatidylglycerol synthase domain-containing protein [Nevskiaceae bacterium]
MNRSPARAVWINVAVLIAAAALVQGLWGWQGLLRPWREVPPGALGLALAGLFSSYGLRAARIYIAETEIPRGAYGACLRLILINNALNWLLPARSGEASFPWLMRRWFGVDGARATGILLWLRLLDLHVLATVAAICAAAGWLAGAELAANAARTLALLAASAPLAIFALRRPLAAWCARPANRLARLAGRVLQGLPQRGGGLLRDLALTWLSWGIKLAALGWVLARLLGLRPALGILGAIGGDLSTVLPLHAPGGFGTYEAGVLALLAPGDSGAPLARLLAAAVNLHLLVLGSALLAGAGAALTGSPAKANARLSDLKTDKDLPP